MKKTNLSQNSFDIRNWAVWQNPNFAFVILDLKGEIVSFNKGAELIKGYSAKEVIGKSFEIFYEKKSVEKGEPQDILARVAKEENLEIEGWRIRKDGTRFWASIFFSVVKDEQGNIFAISKVIRDESERHRKQMHENAVKEIELKLKSAESIHDVINCAFDSILKFTAWETAAFWKPDPKTGRLELALSKINGQTKLEPYLKLSKDFSFPKGEGLPGLTWEKMDYVWIANVQKENFARREIAKQIGIKSAFCFPIIIGSEFFGCLEYTSSKEWPLEVDVIEEISRISGRVAQRIQYLQVRDESTSRLNLLQSIVDGYDGVIRVLSSDGRFLLANKGLIEWYGVAKENLINIQALNDRIPAGYMERVLKVDANVIRTGKSTTSQERTFTNGRARTLLVHRFPIFDKDGTVNSVGAIASDITELDNLRQELQMKNEMISAIMNSTNFSIISTDTKGIIRTYNRRAQELLGYTPEEVIGKLTPDTFHDRSEAVLRTPAVNQELGISIEPGFDTYTSKARIRNVADENEWTYVSKDGRHIPVLLSITTLRDATGEAIGYLGLAVDMSKAKEAEAQKFQITQENQSLHFGLNQSASVAITDKDGYITYANDKFCEISGYSREELVGKNHRVIDGGFHTPEFFHETWLMISRGLLWRGEVCSCKKDGSLYWVDTTIVPQKNEDGSIRQFVFIRIEITSKKKLEMELVISRKKEQEANRAKSDFLATMSHEIRTPLNGVIGMSSLLLESSLTPEQKEIAGTIANSGKILLSIVNDILDFSKIESGKMSLEILEVNLTHYFKDIMKGFQYTAEKKGVALEFKHDEHPYMTYCDQGRVGQVLTNLVSNAIKFTNEGAVRVELHFENKGPTSEVTLAVRDTGVGIPEVAKQKMFQAFTQAEQSTHRRFGGTGLGLSISKKIVDLMGGKISFTSEYGKGTTFTVKLELKNGGLILDGMDRSAQRPTLTEEMKKARILVAEDNSTNQLVISTMLKKLGLYSHHLVANGNEVLDSLRESVYDLILMDCQMPEMDGYEATQAIRHSKTLVRSIPIVALTANASVADERKCLEVGMDGYLTKPLVKETLEEEIVRILSLKWSGKKAAS